MCCQRYSKSAASLKTAEPPMERQPKDTAPDPQEAEAQTAQSPDGDADSSEPMRDDPAEGGPTASNRDAPSGGAARAIARAVLWPLRRFFDPRFAGMAAQISAEGHGIRQHVGALIADQHNAQLREQERMLRMLGEQERMLWDQRRIIVADVDAAAEASTVVGEALRDLQELVEQTHDGAARASGAYLERLSAGDLSDLDADAARFLNYAASHEGFAAQRNLWFNWPLSQRYGPKDVQIADVNERIVEIPYALRAIGHLEPGSRLLDVGAAESTLALSLASLGFEVVALDPRSYPLTHPNLRVESRTLEDWDTEETFGAVFCISTIEHIGSGEYGLSPQTQETAPGAMSRIRELTEPGGTLVLTAPLGSASNESSARIYDRGELEHLLADWEIVDFTVAEHVNDTTWVPQQETASAESVALVTARRPD